MSNTKAVRAAGAALLLLAAGGGVLAGHHNLRGRLHDSARTLYHTLKAAQAKKALAADAPPAERADEPLVIYADNLGDGWQDWSWAAHELQSHAAVHAGAASLRMTPTENKGVYLHHDGVGTLGYGALQFYVRGHSALNVCLVDGDRKFQKYASLRHYVTSGGEWERVRIPLADLDAPKDGETITGVVFQAAGMAAQPAVFLDDITLQPDLTLPPAPTTATVTVTVDERADLHPISRLIYGMAFAPPDYLTDLHLGVNRWGGNDKSRYNWVLGNADNAARDWQFRNRKAVDVDLPPAPSSAADAFVRQNIAADSLTLLTVPTLGWVASSADNNTLSQNVPDSGASPTGSADGAIAGYDPTANRQKTSVRSLPRKGSPFTDNPTLTPGGAVYQDEWVHHLVAHFGDAAHGGVRLYAMDNEPDLWDNTHTDVHPARMGYDDTLREFVTYADAVKDVDPTAQITGPVSWGWPGYKCSALDRGTDNFKSHPDFNRHGGQWFLPWFLAQVRVHDEKTGRRTLDVLDVHYYPQGNGLYGGQDDKDAQARRLRSVRSLWDASYTDESWIGEPVRLLPRLKEWVASSYPGTKIGITEWNFGADDKMDGGLAVCDALGIFGRDGLYLANYWAYPPKNSPSYLAFKLYRNADGAGLGFGDLSCRAVSADPNRLSCYAGVDSRTGALTLMLINKMPRATVTAPLMLGGPTFPASSVQSWRCSADNAKEIVVLPQKRTQGGHLTVILPPYSMTLLRVPKD